MLKNSLSTFFNSSIRNKLMLYFLLVILLPVITITTVSNLIYNNSISDVQNVNTDQMLQQISTNVDFYMKNMENIINTLSLDPRVVSFLNSKELSNGKNTEAMEYDVTKAIMGFTPFHPEIVGIIVVNKNDLYVSDIMYRISRDPLINERWYIEAADHPNKIQLFSKPIGRNVNNVFQYCADDVVSMSKAIIDDKTGKCLGVILIDIKLDIIKSVIESVKPGKTGFVYIVDSNNEIVYTPVNEVVYRIKDQWVRNLKNSVIVKNINNKDYKIMCKGSEYTEWKTVGVFPLDESTKTLRYIKYYSLAVAILTIVFAAILAMIFTRSIVNPINKLRRLMKRTEEGDLNVFFRSKYGDEIGELGNSFNNMIDEIKNLIHLVQAEEKSKRKAEISILQAQIKPHFLYNTLDTIQWMAEEHDAQDIIDVVNALTTLLRIGLSKGNEIVTVRDEIMHIESYLIIQKVRYEDKLDYEIKIQEEMMNFEVTKLILQPIVENAIYHGIKEKRGKGKIIIEGEIVDKKLCFTITDNGAGMSEERLKKLNKVLHGKNPGEIKLGFGVYNVNERIRLSYGEEFGLEFQSTENVGTIVKVWHPLIEGI
ncbi:cache domain-containing sensor histidine kinase [Clostridium zeae]|uniref:cache domain-containing sensor histidine kinase n=1 Tax=Clostridium zeae TaxID=2759022 RepID=UPI001A8FC1D6|nr:sensor histidine kinase [Clostridium zeae]